MPGIWIERGGYLREILRLLGAGRWDCWWLITGLECYQTNWPGGEKWAQEALVLPNAELLRDVEARDMQFVWGIFSAIPSSHSPAEIAADPPPEFTDSRGRSRYLRACLLPQHPLAFLEIAAEDSTSITAVAREEEILRPLRSLSCWTEDAEASNRRFLAMEEIIGQLAAEMGYGRMSDHTHRNLCALLWRKLYHHQPRRPVRREEVEAAYLRLWKGES